MTPDGPTPHDTLEYDAETDTYHVEYSCDTAPPSHVLVEAVGLIEGRDPLDLAPLGETIDPKALDAVLCRGRSRRDDSGLSVSVRYHGYEVTLDEYGHIVLTATSDASAGTGLVEGDGTAD
jgi:hypothetical protein